MENHKEFIPEIVDLFQAFLNKEVPYKKFNEESLISGLKKIEKKVKAKVRKTKTVKKDEGFWFRLFDGDLVNTITDVERRLDINRGRDNHKHFIESMEIAIENPNGMSVYFS